MRKPGMMNSGKSKTTKSGKCNSTTEHMRTDELKVSQGPAPWSARVLGWLGHGQVVPGVVGPWDGADPGGGPWYGSGLARHRWINGVFLTFLVKTVGQARGFWRFLRVSALFRPILATFRPFLALFDPFWPILALFSTHFSLDSLPLVSGTLGCDNSDLTIFDHFWSYFDHFLVILATFRCFSGMKVPKSLLSVRGKWEYAQKCQIPHFEHFWAPFRVLAEMLTVL